MNRRLFMQYHRHGLSRLPTSAGDGHDLVWGIVDLVRRHTGSGAAEHGSGLQRLITGVDAASHQSLIALGQLRQ